MTLAEARPVIAALGESAPPELGHLSADSEAGWGAWVAQRDAAIRARIVRGDEDSVVNLMLYGTTFTRRPRATPEAIAAARRDLPLAEVMDGRLQDLLDAVEGPAGDARVAFARYVIERQGLAVGARSRESTRAYLQALRSRVLADNEQYARRAAAADAGSESERRAAYATLYRDRGLSTDSSLRVDFALDRALGAVRERRVLDGRAERVAVVGPGLDFIDKAQGHDFYPVQMIQPFALADSLMRTGLATRPSIAALDISARVLDHLRDARQRARQGKAYRWNLVLERNSAGLEIDPEFTGYWRRAGDRIGTTVSVEGAAPIESVQARAIAIRPEAVLAVEGVDHNIIFERIPASDDAGRFDLLVATNVLVYYDSFEQALAVSNMAGMLRAGGLLLTNQPVPLPNAWGLSPVFIMSVAFDRLGSHQRGDAIHVYRKVEHRLLGRVASGFSRKDVLPVNALRIRAPHAAFRLKPEATRPYGDRKRMNVREHTSPAAPASVAGASRLWPVRYQLIALTFALSMLLYVDRVAISTARGPITSELGLSDTQFGWVLSAFALGYALFQTPGGLIADRFGARLALTSVVTLWSVFTALTGVARTFATLLVYRFLFGAGEAGAYPTCARAFYNWLPVAERGLAQGINFSGARLGAAFALPAIAWLVSAAGWRMAFFALGGIGFVYAAIWWWWFRDLPEEHSSVTARERTLIVNNRSAAATVSSAPLRFAAIVGSTNVWIAMGQYFASNFTFFFCLTWLFPFLQRTYGLQATQAGLLSAAPLVGGAVGNWVGGALVDMLYRRGHVRISRQLPAVAGFVLAAAGLLGSLAADDMYAKVSCLTLAVFGADMTLPPSWAFCIDIGRQHAGAVSGTMNMAGNVGSFVTSLAFPYLLIWTGSPAPFFAVGATLNAGAAILWMGARPARAVVDR